MSDNANIKTALVAGAAAGDVTVTGINLGDVLLGVHAVALTEGTPNTFSGYDEVTSEFSVTADDTINNTGGTSTANKLVLVVWEVRGQGRWNDRQSATSGRYPY